MFSKKQLIITSFVLAILFHFIFYMNLYGPHIRQFERDQVYFIALVSALIMMFIYVGTYWRKDIKESPAVIIYDLLVLWIVVCFFRSALQMRSLGEMKPFLFSNYMALSLFPVLFFIPGVSLKYFYPINRILFIYMLFATLISLFFIKYFELQLFLLLPLFYILITIPIRTAWSKVLILLVVTSVVIVSLTNRAGVLRIFISLCILIVYYLIAYVHVNKRLLNIIVFLILMLPLISLYLGINGQSVFQMVLGSDAEDYSQLNPYADTRTFLYYEVFQDLAINKAFIFGKGLNAGYASLAFETYNRQIVEVGFLQILLKTGIIGFLLYISVIISAIYKALGKSSNLFTKLLGFLLAGYVLMLFIENVIAYNLLNIIIWFTVGMCHSKSLRELSDKDVKTLFNGGTIEDDRMIT